MAEESDTDTCDANKNSGNAGPYSGVCKIVDRGLAGAKYVKPSPTIVVEIGIRFSEAARSYQDGYPKYYENYPEDKRESSIATHQLSSH
jgi:hypothetical protein